MSNNVIQYNQKFVKDIPERDWQWFRKKVNQKMVPVQGPCVFITQEGKYPLPEGWIGWLAADDQGFPYPISAETHDKTYESVQRIKDNPQA